MIDRALNYGRHLIDQFINISNPFTSVLDIGAGSGVDLAIAKRINPASTLYAIECYAPLAKLLKSNGIATCNINIENCVFPYSDESIDLVIANQILEHTKEVFWIFHEVSRILPVGGKFIVGVPNLASLHNRLLLAFGEHPTPIKTASAHIRGFTKNDLLSFVHSCFPGGYKLVAFGGSNFYPFPPVVARPLAKLFPSMAWSIFFLLEKQCRYNGEFNDYPIKERLATNFIVG